MVIYRIINLDSLFAPKFRLTFILVKGKLIKDYSLYFLYMYLQFFMNTQKIRTHITHGWMDA